MIEAGFNTVELQAEERSRSFRQGSLFWQICLLIMAVAILAVGLPARAVTLNADDEVSGHYLQEPSLPATEEYFEFRLPGYNNRLLNEGQSRLRWHTYNEARHALLIGGVMLAGYAAGQAEHYTGFPIGKLITVAGTLMDLTLTRSWKEFLLRFGIRHSLYYWYFLHGKNFSWAPTLLQESPLLLSAAWEMWQQSQTRLPEGVRPIHMSADQPLALFYSYVGAPRFVIHFSQKADGACSESNQRAVSGWEERLACAAKRHGIGTLEVSPFAEHVSSRRSLQVVLGKMTGETLSSLVSIIPSPESKEKPWLTDILSFTPGSHAGIGNALSPLAHSAIDAFVQIMEQSDHSEIHISEDDLIVPVVNGHNMLVTGLTDNTFLLSDHTDTQGTALPEFWLGTGVLSSDQLEKYVGGLEQRRIPGDEYGAWRFLSVARSVAYHSLLSKAYSWLANRYAGSEYANTSNEGAHKDNESFNKESSDSTSADHENIQSITTEDQNIQDSEDHLPQDMESEGSHYADYEDSHSLPGLRSDNEKVTIPATGTDVKTLNISLYDVGHWNDTQETDYLAQLTGGDGEKIAVVGLMQSGKSYIANHILEGVGMDKPFELHGEGHPPGSMTYVDAALDATGDSVIEIRTNYFAPRINDFQRKIVAKMSHIFYVVNIESDYRSGPGISDIDNVRTLVGLEGMEGRLSIVINDAESRLIHLNPFETFAVKEQFFSKLKQQVQLPNDVKFYFSPNDIPPLLDNARQARGL